MGWLDSQPVDSLYLTATSLSELLLGVAYLPAGKRRNLIAGALNAVLERLFFNRILAFDKDAASAYALLVTRARSRGTVVSITDAQIAAISHVCGFTVATRDTPPFQAMGVPVINPWKT